MRENAAEVDGLRGVSLFRGLTGEQLDWVAHQGRELRLEPGGYVAREGDPQGYFHVLLEGRVEWTRRIGQQDVHVLSHEGGMYFGHEPILLDIPVPVTGRALTPVRALKFEGPDAFWQMLSRFPHITRELITTVTERFQTLEAASQQSAKLASLGTMSAGLAHELNNPAAAASRAVEGLEATVNDLKALSLKLGGRLNETQVERLAALEREAEGFLRGTGSGVPDLDPLERGDHEDELAGWLDERGVEDAWELAPTFVGAGLDAERLEEVTDDLPLDSVAYALSYLERRLAVTGLLREARSSSARISKLVKAIKEYTHMDEAPSQEVDIREGLENTLIILGHKLKGGGVTVTREYDPRLPRIRANGSELNQVWTNLIDNAIDALGGETGSGNILIKTAREPGRVLVEVTDDGPGIPPGVLPHIFEPFFTTKGAGTGLGLDISYRIVVGQHKGDIRVESAPGATRFGVRLPIGGADNKNAEAE